MSDPRFAALAAAVGQDMKAVEDVVEPLKTPDNYAAIFAEAAGEPADPSDPPLVRYLTLYEQAKA